MTASTYDIEESLTRRSPISQFATTVFLGIPMTLALVVGLVFYCTYECLKYALSAKPTSPKTPPSDEHTFTNTLTTFASVHAPGQPVLKESAPTDLTAPVERSEISK